MENELKKIVGKKSQNKWLIWPFIFLFLIALFLFTWFNLNFNSDPNEPKDDEEEITEIDKKDLVNDWQYDPGSLSDYQARGSSLSYGSAVPEASLMADSSFSQTSSSIGMAVGGAQDVNNFRKNIENDYLPLPTDISYEGLFYDYYFETGQTKECLKLFCPSYSSAVSADPISNENEYYLSVGLNSGIKEVDFNRKKINLVLVLDISGSMNSSFNTYYYDNPGQEKEENLEKKTKMDIANQSIVALLDQLNGEDRVSIVLFDSNAYLAKPLNLVKYTDMQAIKDHVLEIYAKGGTNMTAGMSMAGEQFKEYIDINRDEYENRIIFLTDAMPNTGDISEEGMIGLARSYSNQGIYSTFIGIGLDFNTELINYITKIKGANYYSVHSEKEFKTRLADEFEFMVTPLVFDLKLELESNDFIILKVYGSPEADEASGEIMKVNTLFPSKVQDGETRGGLILLKLKKVGEGNQLSLKTSYLNRQGISGGDEFSFSIDDNIHYSNSGIRKGIVLTRYANLMKNWINDERMEKANYFIKDYGVNINDGISFIYESKFPPYFTLGEWERKSTPLSINDNYKQMFEMFLVYFNNEFEILEDGNMKQEIEILEKIINADHYICSNSIDCYEKIYKSKGIVCDINNVEFISSVNTNISDWTIKQRQETGLNKFSWECLENKCVCAGEWYTIY